MLYWNPVTNPDAKGEPNILSWFKFLDSEKSIFSVIDKVFDKEIPMSPGKIDIKDLPKDLRKKVADENGIKIKRRKRRAKKFKENLEKERRPKPNDDKPEDYVPPLPVFNDDWPEAVQLKWFDSRDRELAK
jgi:hypothetical protein